MTLLPAASVIVPTHNRPGAIGDTLRHLVDSAHLSAAEIVVVDDGGSPPLSLETSERVRVVRTPGLERSRARNLGAQAARSPLVIFVDDDITVHADFVANHLRASREFGDVLSVGRISLTPEIRESRVGRFRSLIEEPSQERARGIVADENFATAANMSMRRESFLTLGGFDPAILSGEDQDLAMRWSARGGRIVFLPEAEVLHRDAIDSISAYARRHEWGAFAMAPLLRRYAHRPENLVRLDRGRPLGEARSIREALRLSTRHALSTRPSLGALARGISVLESLRVGDRALFPLYRILLGLHLFRGFQRGLCATQRAPPIPGPLANESVAVVARD